MSVRGYEEALAALESVDLGLASDESFKAAVADALLAADVLGGISVKVGAPGAGRA